MELRQLEHFVTVATEQHFTHAADLLGISQSGLSASIRALESELQAPLFVRTTRQVELTAVGAALLPEARRTLASARAARTAVDAVSGLLGGVVTVGSEACPGVLNLAAALAAFRHRHPAVEVRLQVSGSEALIEDVAAGRADVAIAVPVGPLPRNVVSQALGVEPLVVLSHPRREFAQRGHVALTELLGETFVDFGPGASSRILVTRAFAAVGHVYRPELEVNDVHLLLDLILEDLGIAIVPASIARKRPHDLAGTPLAEGPQDWVVSVVTDASPSPAANALRNQFVSSAASTFPSRPKIIEKTQR